MKNLPKKLPPELSRIIQMLDTIDDSTIIFANDDISLRSLPIIKSLTKQGLISSKFSSHISCINCEAHAKTVRTGSKGEKLFAACNVCGSHFRINKNDIKEFQASWNSLASWLATIMDFSDEPEPITENIYFIGHYSHGTVRYEIHLMKGCAARSAKQEYQAIAQQKADPVIILSLSKKPLPCSLDIRIVPLEQCLVQVNGIYNIHFPTRIFSGANPVKQYAASVKLANDPLQLQKNKLYTFLLKKISSYRSVIHPEIAKEISDKHSDLLIYYDNNGNQQRLSKQIVLDIIKEVLIEKGMEDQISGRRQDY